MTESQRYFIPGGAGFIGSHFTDRLLSDGSLAAVTLYEGDREVYGPMPLSAG